MSVPPGKVPCKSPYDGRALKIGEIRLLTIIWTTSDDFELQTECHTLTDDLEFDAISYVWGTAPASVDVKCNDAVLSITPTAFRMLGYLYLFKPEPKRPVWIDAICINQNDVNEKAVQVPKMQQVYSLATSVIVWVGGSTPETAVFVREMNRLPRPWSCEPAASEVDQRWKSVLGPFWTGMADILSARWFQRMWTFQEAVLARQAILLCGTQWLDLFELMEFAVERYYGIAGHPFDKVKLTSPTAMLRCYSTLKFREGGQVDAWEVPALIHTMRQCRTVEEVDRVWALLGLFAKDVQQSLEPLVDYSTVAREQYWVTLVRCMKVVVQMGQQLCLLEIPSPKGPRNPNIPSWCPDFRGRGNRKRIIDGHWNRCNDDVGPDPQSVLTEVAARMTASYEAVSCHAKTDISISQADNILRIHGFGIDTIAEVIQDTRLLGAWAYMNGHSNNHPTYSPQNPTYALAIQWLLASENLARRTHHEPGDVTHDLPEEFLMAFWTTDRLDAHARTAYEDASILLVNGDYDTDFSADAKRCARAAKTVSRFIRLAGHVFFCTEGGRFGLATPGCKPGDKVSVFYGGHPLYIVRAQMEAALGGSVVQGVDELCEFVGTAYVPRLMDQHTTDDARRGPDRFFALV